MRISSLLLSSMCVVMLAACGDNGGGETGDDTTMTPATPGTTVDMTTMVDPTTGPVDPTPVDPTPPDPSSTSTGPEPTTAGPDDTSTGTTTGDPPGGLTCEAYCTTYLDACVDFPIYDNQQACISQCKQWPVGTVDDTDGNTLGCRTYHVGVASAVDPIEHCPHASANGAGVCADDNAPNCQDYCDLFLMNCVGPDLQPYADVDACLVGCKDYYPGTFEDLGNDSIGCRFYHAGAPAMMDDEMHCPHAGPGGGGVCIPPA